MFLGNLFHFDGVGASKVSVGHAAGVANGVDAPKGAEATPHVVAVPATSGIASRAKLAARVATGVDPPETAQARVHGGAVPASAGIASGCTFAKAAMGVDLSPRAVAGASMLNEGLSKLVAESADGAVTSPWWDVESFRARSDEDDYQPDDLTDFGKWA